MRPCRNSEASSLARRHAPVGIPRVHPRTLVRVHCILCAGRGRAWIYLKSSVAVHDVLGLGPIDRDFGPVAVAVTRPAFAPRPDLAAASARDGDLPIRAGVLRRARKPAVIAVDLGGIARHRCVAVDRLRRGAQQQGEGGKAQRAQKDTTHGNSPAQQNAILVGDAAPRAEETALAIGDGRHCVHHNRWKGKSIDNRAVT